MNPSSKKIYIKTPHTKNNLPDFGFNLWCLLNEFHRFAFKSLNMGFVFRKQNLDMFVYKLDFHI